MTVAADMPAKTAVPSDHRDAEPAPVAIISGTTPRMKANDVMRIGRNRSLAPSIAASTIDRPSFSCFAFANSTIRMAFLAASPRSMTRPIWA